MWRDEPSEFTARVGQCFILNGNCQTGEPAGDQELRRDNKCAMCICHPVRTWRLRVVYVRGKYCSLII